MLVSPLGLLFSVKFSVHTYVIKQTLNFSQQDVLDLGLFCEPSLHLLALIHGSVAWLHMAIPSDIHHGWAQAPEILI